MRRLAWFGLAACLFVAAGCASRPGMPDKTGSVGRPDDGRLIGGVQLQSTGDLCVVDAEQAWGTPELCDLLIHAGTQLRAAYPDTAPLVIGDLSAKRGGSLRPHLSHQSGRDVDILLPANDNKPRRRFAEITPDAIDLLKTWYLIETLVATDRVQYILLDWEIQKRIVEEIQIVVPEQVLLEVFQYPRGKRERVGIVRHAAGHREHLHVRIHCPREDAYCIE
jgi:penicillin-insensitive murein endopeptidase